MNAKVLPPVAMRFVERTWRMACMGMLAMTLGTLSTQAQLPTQIEFDVQFNPANDSLRVYVRHNSPSDFGGVLSGLLLTIRYDSVSGVPGPFLGNGSAGLTQFGSPCYTIVGDGGAPVVSGANVYKTYTAVGFQPIIDPVDEEESCLDGVLIGNNQWKLLMRVAVQNAASGAIACRSFQIVDVTDPGRPLNSEIFISLNAVEIPPLVEATPAETDACLAVLDCEGTPNGPALPGTPCDDGNPFTIDDEWAINCQCIGTPTACEDVFLQFTTDGNAEAQTSWQILIAGTPVVVCQNVGPLPNNATNFPFSCCLGDGCYELVVSDTGGDGLVGGGYRLLNSAGRRIIDNSNADAFSTSTVTDFTSNVDTGSPYSFCVPVGDDRLVYVSCDKTWHKINDFVAANANPAVSAIWSAFTSNTSLQRQRTGYEFWFYDPNGTFSFRKFRNHSTGEGAGSGALRACYARVTNVIPEFTKMNVKVRGRVYDGTNTLTVYPWGAACRFARNEAQALCPPTKLMDIPFNQFISCGVTKTWATNQWLHCRQVSGATQYQFRFRNAGENYSVTRTTASYFVQLGWNALSAPVPTLGGTYAVDVRAFVNGNWCFAGDPWGDICNVTFVSPMQGDGNQNMALQGEERMELRAWPNPAQDVLFISEPVSGQIFDLQGRVVMEVAQNNSIAVGGLTPGVYLLRTVEGNTLRFVRE